MHPTDIKARAYELHRYGEQAMRANEPTVLVAAAWADRVREFIYDIIFGEDSSENV